MVWGIPPILFYAKFENIEFRITGIEVCDSCMVLNSNHDVGMCISYACKQRKLSGRWGATNGRSQWAYNELDGSCRTNKLVEIVYKQFRYYPPISSDKR